MANVITTPVELGFTDFVGKLISDTFEAVLSSQANQEEQWLQMHQLLSLDLKAFGERVIDDNVLSAYMIDNFPDGKGGHLIVSGNPYQRANPQRGVEELPAVNAVLGYQPTGKRLTSVEVSEIFSMVRTQFAEKQYNVLQALVNKGNTRVLVEGGKINAKMTFSILQVESDENSGSTSSPSPTSPPQVDRNLVFQKRGTGYTSLVRAPELLNVHLFVKPTTDQDPQTSTVKANIYSEVEIHFKTVS